MLSNVNWNNHTRRFREGHEELKLRGLLNNNTLYSQLLGGMWFIDILYQQ